MRTIEASFPKGEEWWMQWPLAIAAAAVGVAGALTVLVALRPPAALVTWPLAVSIFQLSVTPVCRLAGLYRYHSPLLKVTVRTSRRYEIHAGTSFDWLIRFRFEERGGPAARRFLAYLVEGLLDIASRVESGELSPDIEVTGTSYFFAERTAERLGFVVRPGGLRLRLNLILNYLDLALMYSFTRGRPALPNVLTVREAAIRGDELLRRRPELQRLLLKLEPRRA